MTKFAQYDVLWSPSNPNKFIKFDIGDGNNDINLYQVLDPDEWSDAASKNQAVQSLADNVFVQNIASYSDYNSIIKCIAWCPKAELADHCVLATGLSNGRVSIHNFGSDSPISSGLQLNQVLLPKMERVCNDVAWNSTDPKLIAVGLEKVRSDCSLTVWDVEANVQQQSSRQQTFSHGSGESTYSVKWMPNSPNTLVAGATKWIRLFDIRTQANDPKLIAHTKAIHGLCVDPNESNRIASFAKGQKGAVLVWDIRKPDKAVVTINQTNPVLKVQWCPRRNNMISVLQKDSNAVRYLDLQLSNSSQYNSNIDVDSDSILFERNIMLPKSASNPYISSYDWNPELEMTLLAVTKTGNLHYMKVFERIAMSWSPSSEVMWACGSQMFLSNQPDPAMQDDISFVMKKRAEMGYGEPSVMKDEQKLAGVLNEPTLSKLWTWLKRSKKLRDHEQRKLRKFYGIKAIIKGELRNIDFMNKRKQPSPEKQVTSNIEGRLPKTIEGKGDVIIAPQYTSEERKLALSLCEWDVTEEGLKDRLDRLFQNNEVERAAALALFHNKLDWTIEYLSSGQQAAQRKDLPIVAMALSGYSDRKKGSMWIANCKRFSQQLASPYLRAMFAFLTTDGEDFANVLKENGMDLKDRIAFACRYLSDSKLIKYVENVTSTMKACGNLEGLLLTGLTTEGIDLLETYISKYGDVQTAVLIVLVMKFSEIMKDERVNDWIENYRTLLDKWMLWHKRAQFDSQVQAISAQRKIPNQISVTCTYCNKPVSSNIPGGALRIARSIHKPKAAMSCPNCRQPLPRCSVCMIKMGSLSAHQPRTGNQKPKLENLVNSFQNWFTWCQMCRHGGHAAHLAEWFNDHVECPVTGCNCVCDSLDSVSLGTPTPNTTTAIQAAS